MPHYDQSYTQYASAPHGVQKPSKRKSKRLLAWLTLSVVVLVVGIGIVWGALRVYGAFFGPEDSVAYKESILASLSEHMQLPEGEPEIYKIEDPAEWVANNPLFAKANKGDALVIFRSVGQAFIYSEEEDKIVTILAPRTE